jgi:[ribosomal protein S18]-alanine N-acetyltransferase
MYAPSYPVDRQRGATRVRVLRERDLFDMLPIERRAYEFPWSEGIFRDCFRARHSGLALECQNRLIGYGLLSCAAGEAHLLNVAIDPEYQGLGYGRHLTKRLIDLARWHYAEVLLLEVRQSNTRAQALYQSLGFGVIGERKNYYPGRTRREDACVMRLDLSLKPKPE